MITAQEFKERTFERFWSKIKFGKPDECWEWQRCLNAWGYGEFGFEKIKSGKMKLVLAHRLAYTLVIGKFDEKLKCLHRCDNPCCCNVNHLFIGTDQDNSDDMMAKGRNKKVFMKGSLHGMAILNEEQVKLIKMRLAIGEEEKEIGKIFGVSGGQISSIKLGKSWKHVVLDTSDLEHLNPNITKEKVIQIKLRLSSGETQQSVADFFQISQAAVNKINVGKSWSKVAPEIKKSTRQGSSVLTIDKVKEIKRRLADGEIHRTIAESFNVHPATIWYISDNRTWKHVQI